LQIANAKDIMNTHLGKRVFLIGAIVAIIGLIRIFQKHGKRFFQEKTHYLKYIGVWVVTLVAVLVVFK
jgi:hypothetical protein